MNKDKDNKKALQKVSPQTPQKLGEGSGLAKRGLQDLGIAPDIFEILKKLGSFEAHKKIYYGDPKAIEEYIGWCKEVLNVQPNNRFALSYWAKALGKKGDYVKAIEIATRILNENVEWVVDHIYGFRAECYMNIGEYRKALEDYTRLITIDDDFSDDPFDPELVSSTKKREVFSNIAECYSQLGDFASAHEYVDKAIKEEQEEIDDEKPFVKKAEIYERQGKPITAMKWYYMAVRKFPSDYAEKKFEDAVKRGLLEGTEES